MTVLTAADRIFLQEEEMPVVEFAFVCTHLKLQQYLHHGWLIA